MSIIRKIKEELSVAELKPKPSVEIEYCPGTGVVDYHDIIHIRFTNVRYFEFVVIVMNRLNGEESAVSIQYISSSADYQHSVVGSYDLFKPHNIKIDGTENGIIIQHSEYIDVQCIEKLVA